MPKVTFSNEKDENPENNIQKIELTNIVRERVKGKNDNFFESTIHISRLIYDLSDIIEHIEEGLKCAFPDIDMKERHKSDLIIRLKGFMEK